MLTIIIGIVLAVGIFVLSYFFLDYFDDLKDEGIFIRF